MNQLSVKQVADALGVTPPTIRRYIEAGDIPAIRIGRQYKIDRDDFEKYVKSIRTGKVKGMGNGKD